ncbi:MAG: hypothetical protein IPL78_35915 [Chloroflexi bacterium]|nr:hypothetical protein [Chloroflexota bacterium]
MCFTIKNGGRAWCCICLVTRRAKREVMAMARQVVAPIVPAVRARPDLIDDLLLCPYWEGDLLLEDDILAATVAHFFAKDGYGCQYDGVYGVCPKHHPDVLARILPEVDEHFAAGIPLARTLPKLQAL